MKLLRNGLMLITYFFGVATLFYAIGEIVDLYVLSGGIVPYVRGSGASTFGLWFFLGVLIAGTIAGFSASLTIWLSKLRILRITTITTTLLAAIMAIIDLLGATLNPLGIIWIDILLICLFVFSSIYMLVLEPMVPSFSRVIQKK